MSETKFTRGEWKVSSCGLSVNVNGNKVARAHSGGSIPYTDPAKHNAHLIAAAPEMYEYLSHMIEHDVISDPSIDREVKSLLAKARGEK